MRFEKKNIKFCIIAEEVTNEHASKKVLLVCLRFLQNIGPNVQEIFLDTVHIQGSTTDKNIAEHVLNNLKKYNINIQNCRRQAYHSASPMSSDKKGAQSYINQVQPKAEYTHSINDILNLAIVHACKNLFT